MKDLRCTLAVVIAVGALAAPAAATANTVRGVSVHATLFATVNFYSCNYNSSCAPQLKMVVSNERGHAYRVTCSITLHWLNPTNGVPEQHRYRHTIEQVDPYHKVTVISGGAFGLSEPVWAASTWKPPPAPSRA